MSSKVCSGTTGHVEVYDFEFSGDQKTFEDLVKQFFMFHDPTTLNRQGVYIYVCVFLGGVWYSLYCSAGSHWIELLSGNDRGTQYASAIFCYDDVQKEIATKVKNELQEKLKAGILKSCRIPYFLRMYYYLSLVCMYLFMYVEPSSIFTNHVHVLYMWNCNRLCMNFDILSISYIFYSRSYPQNI